MKIKSCVWYWLAAASGTASLLYGMGIEGVAQMGSASQTASLPRPCAWFWQRCFSCGWALPPRIVSGTPAAMAALIAPTPAPRSRSIGRTGGAHE